MRTPAALAAHPAIQPAARRGVVEASLVSRVPDRRADRAAVEPGPLARLGKVGVPDHLLNKPGALTPDEYEEMKKHRPTAWK